MLVHKKVTFTKEELNSMYTQNAMTMKEIAIKGGVTIATISVWLKKYGIPARQRAGISPELLKDWYLNKKMSLGKISKQLGYPVGTILYRLIKHNVQLRSRKEASPKLEDHHLWKGGRYASTAGYMMVTLPGGKRQYEHRYIMETYLKRQLKREEHVHHINGNKSDNRIENLMILSGKIHIGEDQNKHKNWYHLKKEAGSLLRENSVLKAKITMLQDEILILKENL